MTSNTLELTLSIEEIMKLINFKEVKEEIYHEQIGKLKITIKRRKVENV